MAAKPDSIYVASSGNKGISHGDMQPTKPKAPVFDKIPVALRGRPQWLLWRLEERDGKATKVPYQAKAPSKKASSTDPATWADFETARNAYLNTPGVTGIGFVFTDDDPFVGIDVDRIRDLQTGEMNATRLEEARGFGSYAEYSQSGNGIHVIAIGTKRGKKCRKGDSEMYSTGRFFVMTGDHIDGTPHDVKEAAPGSLEAFYETISQKAIPTVAPHPIIAHGAVNGAGLSDKEIIEKARTANNGAKFSALYDGGNTADYDSHSEADSALCAMLRFYTRDASQIDRIFRSSGLMREKWDTVHGDDTYGNITIKNALSLPGDTYTPSKRLRKLAAVKTPPVKGSGAVLSAAEKAAIMKAVPSELEEAIETGGALVHLDATTPEELRKLALYLLKIEAKTPSAVIKALAGRVKKWPEDKKIDAAGIAALVKAAQDELKRATAAEIDAATARKNEATIIVGVSESSPDIIDEAIELLTSGDPIAYHRKAFEILHSGDHEIADVWLMGAMTQAALTTEGIQPGFTGKKGAGKSSGTRAALWLHPREYIEDGSFSQKGLLYDRDLPPGMIFYADDTYMDGEMMSMIKRAMTCFQEGITHKTVNKVDGANVGVKLAIPPRCLFSFSSVHSSGDSELRDRQYLISLSPTPADDKRFINHLLTRLADGQEKYPITREVLVCREMIRQIKQKVFRPIVPFRDRLTFSDPGARRDNTIFLDFVQASAVLHHMRRRRITNDDGTITVFAEDDDFRVATMIFQASEQTRRFKISKNERALLTWLANQPDVATFGITEQEIVTRYGAVSGSSRSSIRADLYGRHPESGDSGICNTVPGVFSQKRRTKADAVR